MIDSEIYIHIHKVFGFFCDILVYTHDQRRWEENKELSPKGTPEILLHLNSVRTT